MYIHMYARIQTDPDQGLPGGSGLPVWAAVLGGLPEVNIHSTTSITTIHTMINTNTIIIIGISITTKYTVIRCITPGLHNKIPAHKIFARVWVAQKSLSFIGSG